MSEAINVAADADVLMNLLATECAVEILEATRHVFLVAPAIDREALYLESDVPGSDREAIDLNPLEEARVLQKIVLADAEVDRVIELVRLVDDGEAEVIAVAWTRGIAMATDDRKAQREARSRGIAVLTTPDLLHNWQSAASVPDQRIGQIAKTIRRRSRYVPPIAHPLYEWWTDRLV